MGFKILNRKFMAPAIRNWSAYYRASLADGARCCPDEKQIADASEIEEDAFRSGRLPPDVTSALRKKGREKKKSKDVGEGTGKTREVDEDDDVDVFVFPWGFNSEKSRGKGPDNRWVAVVIGAKLGADGRLQPQGYAPWIPRDRLYPLGKGPAVGELSEADVYAAENGYAPKGWADVIGYAEGLVERVSGRPATELAFPGYVRAMGARVGVAEEVVDGASKATLTLYDCLAKSSFPVSALHGLMEHAGTGGPEPLRPFSGGESLAWAAKHWATVSDEHPLAASQRLALAHLIALPTGAVLAVQGPPGTGKTTLLKSVVAQLWVEAVVNGGPCPIIAASSTNNQAVTNIIDAFMLDDAAAPDGWRRRWLPEVRSLGLYAATADKVVEAIKAGKNYQTLTGGWAWVF